MSDYSIVVGPPGIGLRSVASKLQNGLDTEVADLDTEVADIEDKMKLNPDVVSVCGEKATMEQINTTFPRTKISQFWKSAAKQCVKELAESEKEFKVLTGHLVYYSSRWRMFYSVVDRDSLGTDLEDGTSIHPKSVVLLLDDIYDMYERLSNKGDLFDPALFEDYILGLGDKEINWAGLSNARKSFHTMKWLVGNYLELLFWRNIEMLTAQNLADNLGAEFLIWPVKQCRDSLQQWMSDTLGVASAYLSHPISQPRREQKLRGEWPDFTEEVNELQQAFSSVDVLLAMPTSIDEFRFRSDEEGRNDGHLRPRWPLIEPQDSLLYTRPSGVNSADFNDALRPRYWGGASGMQQLSANEADARLRNELNALIETLKGQIALQTAARDFVFIYCNKAFLVYRPYYGTTPRTEFSSGVEAELELWKQIVRLGEQKRLAIVHFRDDLTAFLHKRGRQLLITDISNALPRAYAVKGMTWVTSERARNMIESRGTLTEAHSILGGREVSARDRTKAKDEFPHAFREAKTDALRKYMLGPLARFELPSELVGIWVLQDVSEANQAIQHIGGFFVKGEPRGNEWEKLVDDIFPNTLVLDD